MAFEEDFSLFLDTADFAVDAQVTTTLGEILAAKVLFDQPHADGLGVMESIDPSALGRTVDLEHATHLLIGDATWLVVGRQPDGTGMTRLLLEAVS